MERVRRGRKESGTNPCLRTKSTARIETSKTDERIILGRVVLSTTSTVEMRVGQSVKFLLDGAVTDVVRLVEEVNGGYWFTSEENPCGSVMERLWAKGRGVCAGEASRCCCVE